MPVLLGSRGQSPRRLSDMQPGLGTPSVHPSGLYSGAFEHRPLKHSFSLELVVSGSAWTSVFSSTWFSFRTSAQGTTELSLTRPTGTAVWPSPLEARPSEHTCFFLPVLAGDWGDSDSNNDFDLAVGEKEASVGRSGSGLGMSRIKWPRFDANLLWKDLGDEELVVGCKAGFTAPFSFTNGLFFSGSPEEFNCFSGTCGLMFPSVRFSAESPRHRFSPTDMLRDILAMKLVVGFM